MVNYKINDSELQRNEHYFNPFEKSSRILTDKELDNILNNDLPLVEEPKDEKKDKNIQEKRINSRKLKQDNYIIKRDDNINKKSQCNYSSNIQRGRKKKKNFNDINTYDIQLDHTATSLMASTDSSKLTEIVKLNHIPLANKLVKEISDFKGYKEANTEYDYKLPDFNCSKKFNTTI